MCMLRCTLRDIGADPHSRVEGESPMASRATSPVSTPRYVPSGTTNNTYPRSQVLSAGRLIAHLVCRFISALSHVTISDLRQPTARAPRNIPKGAGGPRLSRQCAFPHGDCYSRDVTYTHSPTVPKADVLTLEKCKRGYQRITSDPPSNGKNGSLFPRL